MYMTGYILPTIILQQRRDKITTTLSTWKYRPEGYQGRHQWIGDKLFSHTFSKERSMFPTLDHIPTTTEVTLYPKDYSCTRDTGKKMLDVHFMHETDVDTSWSLSKIPTTEFSDDIFSDWGFQTADNFLHVFENGTFSKYTRSMREEALKNMGDEIPALSMLGLALLEDLNGDQLNLAVRLASSVSKKSLPERFLQLYQKYQSEKLLPQEGADQSESATGESPSPTAGPADFLAAGLEQNAKSNEGQLDADAKHMAQLSVQDPVTHDRILAQAQMIRKAPNRKSVIANATGKDADQGEDADQDADQDEGVKQQKSIIVEIDTFDSNQGGKITGCVIALIVIGCMIVVLGAVAMVLCCVMKKKKRREGKNSEVQRILVDSSEDEEKF